MRHRCEFRERNRERESSDTLKLRRGRSAHPNRFFRQVAGTSRGATGPVWGDGKGGVTGLKDLMWWRHRHTEPAP